MSVSKRIPWVIKYRPKKIDELINQDEAKALVKAWLKSWEAGKPEKKAALFYGPPGSGKTSMVEAICNEYGYQLVEMNASDYRRASDIERVAKAASLQKGLFTSKRLILLDEVDGVSGVADEGAIEAILDLIETTKNPIVMTANNPWDTRLRPVRDKSLLVEFKRLTKTEVLNLLKKICLNEKLTCEEEALKFIAEKSEGDLRSAINDLEAVAEGAGKVTLDLVKQVLRTRDRVLEPFEVVRNILKSNYVWQAKQNASQTDLAPDELIQWISENLPFQITDPEDLWRAYEALSKADVYMGRIVKSGSWDLLAYAVELMSAGVALSIVNDVKSKYRWVKYQFPNKIKLLTQTKEARALRDNIAELIGKQIHASKQKVINYVLPYVRIIFDNNPEMAAKIAISLNLTDSMVKYLSQRNAEAVLSYVRELRKAISEEVKSLKPSKKSSKASTPAKESRSIQVGEKEGKGLKAFFKKA